MDLDRVVTFKTKLTRAVTEPEIKTCTEGRKGQSDLKVGNLVKDLEKKSVKEVGVPRRGLGEAKWGQIDKKGDTMPISKVKITNFITTFGKEIESEVNWKEGRKEALNPSTSKVQQGSKFANKKLWKNSNTKTQFRVGEEIIGKVELVFKPGYGGPKVQQKWTEDPKSKNMGKGTTGTK